MPVCDCIPGVLLYFFAQDDWSLSYVVQRLAGKKGSTFANLSARWPDFKPGMPARPSVVAATKNDSGVIGN